MIPAWSLGVLLLGYIFGFPVPFNSTQRQYEYETLLQVNDTVGKSTQPSVSNETEIPFPFQDYVYAIPQYEYETLLQVNDTVGKSTQPSVSNETEIPFPFQDYVHAIPASVSRCYLPTCMTSNLGSALQKGDEIAGASTNDPHGIGRK